MTDTRSISKAHYRKQKAIVDNALAILAQATLALDDSRKDAYGLGLETHAELLGVTDRGLYTARESLAKVKTALIRLEKVGL